MTRDWVKLQQGRNDAADQQPWRCVECGEAVSYIRRNDCRCIREARAQVAPMPEGGSAGGS